MLQQVCQIPVAEYLAAQGGDLFVIREGRAAGRWRVAPGRPQASSRSAREGRSASMAQLLEEASERERTYLEPICKDNYTLILEG